MSKDIAVIAKDIRKQFKIPLDKSSGLKQHLVNFYKRKRGYREFIALDGVSFEVRKGEFFGVVGRNGSGKSTLLKILTGVYTADSGAVAVNGSLTPFIELGVGFNPELSGRENVFLNGALLGFSRQEMEAMYDDIVDFAELHDFMEERLKNYSSGMQVRLAFSIAIRARTDVLILDEVLAVGDAAFQQKCNDYFEQIKGGDQTVILVTHNMDAVKRYCTRAVYIKNGKVHKEGDPFEVADNYLMDNILGTQGSEADELYVNIDTNIRVEIVENNEKHVKFKIEYTNNTNEKCYARISLMSNGVGVGNIDSDAAKPLSKKGSLHFTINKSYLNPGDYSTGAALVRSSNQETIAATRSQGRKVFLVKGKDTIRTGALKLDDTWEY